MSTNERKTQRAQYAANSLGTPETTPVTDTPSTAITFSRIAGNFAVAICINDTDETDDTFYVSILGGFHWKIGGFTLGLTPDDWDALLAGNHGSKDLNVGGSDTIKGAMYGNVSIKKATRTGGASMYRKPKAE